jgi:hypothetical protein
MDQSYPPTVKMAERTNLPTPMPFLKLYPVISKRCAPFSMWVEHLNTVNFSVLQLAAVDTILSTIVINSKNGSCGSKA